MDNISYSTYKNLIDEHILDFLPEIDHKSITVYEAMKYSLTAGGKRLRPILLLAACEFVGGDVQNAIPYACAMEYIHTYSLIHDDLPAMDDDELRRGVPTNHVVYGEAMAILAGDGLLTSAFEAMNKDMLLYLDDPIKLKRRIRAIYEISKGAGCRGMVAGQVADIEAENKQCSKEMLDYIHLNKTAALITASVRAGAY
ncbi:polyprenyl synthetase family protein, partial [Aminipila sp.]